MSHPLVIQVLAGIKRMLACPTVKKEPITPEILSNTGVQIWPAGCIVV